MKFEGIVYDDKNNKICNFYARTKQIVPPFEIPPLVPENTIIFETYHIQELDIMKITQLYKTICEML